MKAFRSIIIFTSLFLFTFAEAIDAFSRHLKREPVEKPTPAKNKESLTEASKPATSGQILIDSIRKEPRRKTRPQVEIKEVLVYKGFEHSDSLNLISLKYHGSKPEFSFKALDSIEIKEVSYISRHLLRVKISNYNTSVALKTNEIVLILPADTLQPVIKVIPGIH